MVGRVKGGDVGHRAGPRDWVHALVSWHTTVLTGMIFIMTAQKRGAQYSSCTRRIFASYLAGGVTSLLCPSQRDIRAGAVG